MEKGRKYYQNEPLQSRPTNLGKPLFTKLVNFLLVIAPFSLQILLIVTLTLYQTTKF